MFLFSFPFFIFLFTFFFSFLFSFSFFLSFFLFFSSFYFFPFLFFFSFFFCFVLFYFLELFSCVCRVGRKGRNGRGLHRSYNLMIWKSQLGSGRCGSGKCKTTMNTNELANECSSFSEKATYWINVHHQPTIE